MKPSIKIVSISKFIYFLLALTSFLSCRKYISVPPPINNLTSANVYGTDATAASVLTNIYATMVRGGSAYSGINGENVLTGCSSDELVVFNVNNNTQEISQYFKNSLTAKTGTTLWQSTYPLIFDTNAAIDGLNSSTRLTPDVKQQLLGEAFFMRSYFYFQLVNLYGDIPLALTINYKVNGNLYRTPKVQVYQQIINDLKQAETFLSPNFLAGDGKTSTIERLRPSKWAAAALLSRVYLYYGNLTKDEGNYVNAETEASSVIANTGLFSLDTLNGVFLKNSNEAIWQLQPVANGTGSNTPDGSVFTLPTTGPNTYNFPVYLNNNLLNSFENGDQRKTHWISTVTAGGISFFYPYKYKIGIVNTSTREYLMMFRLGEQYLIRAEARAQQNNLSGAMSDLNVIRTRAGLGNANAASQSELLTAVNHERQVELFTEGHRWLDLKRTNTINHVMNVVTPQKGGTWDLNWALYPIPLSEIQTDPSLKQNPGY